MFFTQRFDLKRAIEQNDIRLIDEVVLLNGIETTDKNGYTALHLATIEGNIDTVKHLVEQYQANVQALDKNKKSVMHLSAQNDHAHLLQYFFDLGVTFSEKDTFGFLPLDYAVSCFNEDCVETIKQLALNDNTICSPGI